jgi:hypothetical protein
VVALIAIVGFRIGSSLVSGGPVVQLSAGAPVQQIRTSTDVYLGKVVSADGDYLRLAGPAILRQQQPQPSGGTSQLIVIRLTADPFDVDGDLLIDRQDVVSVGNVVRDSGLERAYRQAIGDLPAPSPGSSVGP